jgi:hypothetical protein
MPARIAVARVDGDGLIRNPEIARRDVLAGEREEGEPRLEPPREHGEPGEREANPDCDVHQSAACDQEIHIILTAVTLPSM